MAFGALATGVRSRDFWLIAGGYFVCGATTNGLIGTHLIAACVDHGLSEVAGAGSARRNRRLRSARRDLVGVAQRSMGQPAPFCCLLRIARLSLLYLPFAFDMSFYGLPLFSIVYGLDWIASAPPTVRLLSGVVGTERIGIMVAWITVIHQIGSASAAYLAGVLRITFGTYLEAFMISGVLLIAVAVMVLFVSTGRSSEPKVDPP